MGVMKSRRIDDKEKGKRALYSEGAVPGSSKLSGVNKTFLLGALPYSQENYSNVKLLLSQLDMSDMKPTFSPDMKMAIYLIGKVYSTCKFPCIFGSGTSPFTDICELLTVGDASGGMPCSWQQAARVQASSSPALCTRSCSSTRTRPFSLTSSTFRSCT